MKKLFIAVAAIFTLGVANAQKGSILVYGNVDAATTSNDGPQSISLTPGVGFGLDDKWTLGAELGVSAVKGGSPSFQVGPFLRRTWPISNIFSVYSQLGVGYMTQGQASSTMETPYTGIGKGMYATLSGPSVFVNVKNNFGMNFGFGQLYFTNTKPKVGDNTSAFGLNFGKSFTVGISKTFGGKK